MNDNSYDSPVKALLDLGEPPKGEILNYAALGISDANIPELIRMATDEALNNGDPESTLVWAPLHAWRALGRLRAEQAIEPLIGLFRWIEENDDDWAQSELPNVLAQIGPAAIEPAAKSLADRNKHEWARVAAAETLGKIAETHPDARAECVAKLAAQLEKFAEQGETLNAFLIMPLLDLKAIETLPLMERAFAANCVDESIVGDLEDVQIELGLKAKRENLGGLSPWLPYDSQREDIRETLLEIQRDDPKVRAIMDEEEYGYEVAEPYVAPPKIGRNEPCPCGSGKKYKKCCGA